MYTEYIILMLYLSGEILKSAFTVGMGDAFHTLLLGNIQGESAPP